MLGAKEGVTDQNMLQYLGIIEERTNQLLYIQAYMMSQKVWNPNIIILYPALSNFMYGVLGGKYQNPI